MRVMSKSKPVAIKIVSKAGERFVVSTYADGTESREPVTEKKPTRRPMRPWRRLIDKTKKKQF